MEKVRITDCERIAEVLEQRKKYLLSAYCNVATEIENTLSKLFRQVDMLGKSIEDLNLSAVRYRIISSILDDAGITELLHEMDDLIHDESSITDKSKLQQAVLLLNLENWKDIYSYIKQINQAVQLLRAI